MMDEAEKAAQRLENLISERNLDEIWENDIFDSSFSSESTISRPASFSHLDKFRKADFPACDSETRITKDEPDNVPRGMQNSTSEAEDYLDCMVASHVGPKEHLKLMGFTDKQIAYALKKSGF